MDEHNLSKSIKDVIDLIQWHEKSNEITIVLTDRTNKQRTTIFDQRRIQQVILNVLSNAFKFQKRGQIHVVVEEFRRKDSGAIMFEITVIDEGIGIREDEI